MFARYVLPILLSMVRIDDFVRAEEPKTAQDTMKTFLNAMADADLKGMGKFYAAKVIVKQGSTMLDKKYGGLGGEDGRKKDVTVERDTLLKTHEKTIKIFGGKEHWIERGQRLKTSEIRYVTDESDDADKIFRIVGANKGDVFAIVTPKGDSLYFLLRKIDGKWRIIVERWD